MSEQTPQLQKALSQCSTWCGKACDSGVAWSPCKEKEAALALWRARGHETSGDLKDLGATHTDSLETDSTASTDGGSVALSALSIDADSYEILDDFRTERFVLGSAATESLDDFRNILSDAPAEEDAEELARIIEIERLLNMMNMSSEELNASQKAMSIIDKCRRRALSIWPIRSARLIKAIGNDQIQKAAPHHRQQRLVDAARSQVAMASTAFLEASEQYSSEARREKLAQRHAGRLAEYEAAQQNASKLLRHGAPAPAWLLESTAPYFEAEAAHHVHLEELRRAELRTCRQIASAKSQYNDALRGLEAMSEAEHRAQSSPS